MKFLIIEYTDSQNTTSHFLINAKDLNFIHVNGNQFISIYFFENECISGFMSHKFNDSCFSRFSLNKDTDSLRIRIYEDRKDIHVTGCSKKQEKNIK